MTSDLRAEVGIWPFNACVMHPAIINGTVRSLCTWLWGRYHVPQNVFVVFYVVVIKYVINVKVV